MAENENNKQWQKHFNEQQATTEEMAQTIREDASKNINRDELLSALEETKDKLDPNKNEEEFAEISKSIMQLKSFQEEELTPDMYKDIVGDLLEDFNEQQGSLLQEMLQEVGGLNEVMKSGFDRVSGVVSDAFSPLMELKELGLGIFEMFQGIFSKIGGIINFFRGRKQGSQEEKEQVNLLDNVKQNIGELTEVQKQQLNLSESEQRASMRESPGEDGLFAGGLAEILGTIVKGALIGLGTAIGASIRSITLPFEIIGRAVKKFTPIARWFDNIIDMTIGILGKMPGGTKILGFFQKIFQWSQSLLKVARSASGLLGPLVSGLKFGFRILGWPLTILLGVIDFVKGFTKEQGSLVDKIKSGLQEAVTGFVELPVKLLGWIADWVLGMFGVEIKGGAGKLMMKSIRKTIEIAIDSIIGVFKVTYQAIDWLISAIGNVGKDLGIWESIGSIFKSFFNILKGIGKLIWDQIQFLYYLFTGDFKQAGKEIMQMFKGVGNIIKEVFNVIFEYFEMYIIAPIKFVIDWIFGKGTSKNISTWIKETISDLFSGIWTWIKGFIPSWSDIKKGISTAFDLVGWLVSKIKGLVSGIGDWIKGFIPSWSDIKKGISAYFDLVGWLVSKIKGLVSDIGDYIKGLIPSLGDIKEKIGGGIKSAWSALTGGDDEKQDDEKQKVNPQSARSATRTGMVGEGAWQDTEGKKGGWRGTEGKQGEKGGIIPKTGLYKLHEGEQVLPERKMEELNDKGIIKNLEKESTKESTKEINIESERKEESKQNIAIQKQILQKLDSIQRSLTRDTQKETGDGNIKTESEMPDEIESLSLMIFNKSWGIT